MRMELQIERKPDGFAGETYIVLPTEAFSDYIGHPLVRRLYLTDAGFFPHAAHHYRERSEGIEEYIFLCYVDGKPVVQSKIKVNGDIATGCYKVQSKQDITDDGRIRNISFGNSSIYQYTGNESSGFSGSDDISGFSSNGVKENCAAVDETGMTTIFNTMQDTWPVIVYNNENIGG